MNTQLESKIFEIHIFIIKQFQGYYSLLGAVLALFLLSTIFVSSALSVRNRRLCLELGSLSRAK
jgi:hypothetical protein